MSTKALVLTACLIFVIGFAAGKYDKDDKVVSITKTTTTDTTKDTKVTDTNTDVHRTTVITVRPDGEKVTTITDNSTVDTKTHDTSIDTSKSTTDTYKEVLNNTNKLNVSFLAGAKFPTGANPLVYGASISKPIIGPITIGAWGLSDRTFGLSLGINL